MIVLAFERIAEQKLLDYFIQTLISCFTWLKTYQFGAVSMFKLNKVCLTHFEIFLNAIPVSVVETPLGDITPACILM